MAENFSTEYRQGYLNGYEQAFNDLNQLFTQHDYSFEEAKEACRAFWTDQLSDWLENNGEQPMLYIPTSEDKGGYVTTTVEPEAETQDPYEGKTAL